MVVRYSFCSFRQAKLTLNDRKCLKLQIYNISSMVADLRNVQASEQMKVDNDEMREIDIIIGDEYLAEISCMDPPAALADHGEYKSSL